MMIGFFLSTIMLDSGNEIRDFVSLILNDVGSKIPDWSKSISFYNDAKLKDEIVQNNQTIENLAKKNVELEKNLDKNNYYKSILYQTGYALVSVVFDILQKLIGIDLSDFKDVKREDFSFVIENCHFVGEIKGVSDGLKNQYPSQVETHIQEYLEEKNVKKAKGILIIAYERNKPLEERNKVAAKQINYAVRNNILIITTDVLLDIFETYLNGTFDKDLFLKYISEETGCMPKGWNK